MVKKILITGSSGLLGSELLSLLKPNEKFDVLAPNRTELDITNYKNVKNYIEHNSPNIVIHTAAHTNVEEAELFPELAYRINTMATGSIATACLNTDATLVFISSTGIYGKKDSGTWKDYETPMPSTIHHTSKLKAEDCVRQLVKRHLILRTGWLFGGPLDNPKNFVYNRIKEAEGKDVIYTNSKQFGNPTSAYDLSKQIELLIEEGVFGTYNCVNKGVVSRLEYIKTIYGYSRNQIEIKANEGDYKRLADVSNNESAENYYLDFLGLDIMPDFRDSLKNYINERIG